MNYRELFEKYKKGLVSEEEKKIVEEELEKYEAIEDYLSEIIDEKSNDSENTTSLEEHKEETIKLRKDVKRRLRKVVFTSVAIVIALYISIFYVLSSIIDLIYYNPNSTTYSEGDYKAKDILYDMQAYVSLNMPGYVVHSVTAGSKGFGKYEIYYSLKDLFNEKSQYYFLDISRDRVNYGIDGIFGYDARGAKWYGFELINDVFEEDSPESMMNKIIKERTEETIRYLENLNPLSYVSMTIVFDKDLTMEEFYNLTYEFNSLDFKWVGIRTVEPGKKWSESHSMLLIGFNPKLSDEPSYPHHPDPVKYPLFYLGEVFDIPITTDYKAIISEAYATHFRSRLQYLRDREEFVKLVDYGDFKIDFYQDALDYIDEYGVKTYGVRVFGKVEDFLESIDKIPYASLYINEVLPAKPNIYHK